MQISRGQILIRAHATLPQQLSVKGDRLQDGWIALSENAHEIDRKVRNADWHFFWITDQFDALAVGRREDEVLMSALRKSLRKINARYNAAEVLEVRHKRLLGAALLSCQGCQSPYSARGDSWTVGIGWPPFPGPDPARGDGIRPA